MNEVLKNEMTMGEEIAAFEKKYKEYYDLLKKNRMLKADFNNTLHIVEKMLLIGMTVVIVHLCEQIGSPLVKALCSYF